MCLLCFIVGKDFHVSSVHGILVYSKQTQLWLTCIKEKTCPQLENLFNYFFFNCCFLQGAETWWSGDLEVDAMYAPEPVVWMADGSLSIQNI